MLGKGKILFDTDFNAVIPASTVPNAAGEIMLGSPQFTIVGVNEGSYFSSLVLPNGVLILTTDTADDDNHAIIGGGKYRPADGPLTMEARFQIHHLTCAVFFGFTETLALDTPVMPAEFATATMTYNGTGAMLGLQYDVDGTADDFRAVMGQGGANVGGSASAQGVRANGTPTIDSWMEARVIMNPDGSGEVWFGDLTRVDGSGNVMLKRVKRYDAGLTPTKFFYPVLMIENRDGNARIMNIDYFRGWANRTWTAA